jgi:hypothetical protein
MNPWIAWVLGMPVGAGLLWAWVVWRGWSYDREIERIGSPGNGDV